MDYGEGESVTSDDEVLDDSSSGNEEVDLELEKEKQELLQKKKKGVLMKRGMKDMYIEQESEQKVAEKRQKWLEMISIERKPRV
jgi:hypothetical protein